MDGRQGIPQLLVAVLPLQAVSGILRDVDPVSEHREKDVQRL